MAIAGAEQRPLQKLLVVLDAVIVLIAVGVAPLERSVVATWLPLRDLPPFGVVKTEYTLLVLITLPVWLTLAARLDLYVVVERSWTLLGLARRVLELHVVGFVVLATVLYATQVVLNRSLLGLFLINSMLGMFVARAALVGWTRFRYARGEARTRLLLVGAPGGQLAAFARHAAEADYPPLVVGYLTPDGEVKPDEPEPAGLERLGSLGELPRVLHDVPIDQVLFFRPYDRADAIEEALLACETVGIPAFCAVDVGLPPGAVPRLSAIFERPFASLEATPRRADRLVIKHLIDFVSATTLVLLLAPLLLLVALAILVTMGRPIFYVQARAGLRGRPFRMLKFRTMVPDADRQKAGLHSANEMTGPVFKIERDPRVTGLGRVLRKTSIDELPQLLHVVTGTMSLVGPRPLPLAEQREIHGWHRRRLAMRPGITGLWQVSGRSETTFERWMELDLEYVDRWSLWLDLKILLLTIPVVLLQRGAR